MCGISGIFDTRNRRGIDWGRRHWMNEMQLDPVTRRGALGLSRRGHLSPEQRGLCL